MYSIYIIFSHYLFYFPVSLYGQRVMLDKFMGFMIVAESEGKESSEAIPPHKRKAGNFQIVGDSLTQYSDKCQNAVTQTSHMAKNLVEVSIQYPITKFKIIKPTNWIQVQSDRRINRITHVCSSRLFVPCNWIIFEGAITPWAYTYVYVCIHIFTYASPQEGRQSIYANLPCNQKLASSKQTCWALEASVTPNAPLNKTRIYYTYVCMRYKASTNCIKSPLRMCTGCMQKTGAKRGCILEPVDWLVQLKHRKCWTVLIRTQVEVSFDVVSIFAEYFFEFKGENLP